MSETTTKKRKLSRPLRKATAIGFVIAAVLSVGVASATQLNMIWGGNFQAGAVTVQADCQPTAENITAKFGTPTWNGTGTLPWTVSSVTFSGVNTACSGATYEGAYKLATGDWIKITGGTVTLTTTSFTMALPAGLDGSTIKNLALTINK